VTRLTLAQRKLNEPYSGGLSSYSLLLLLVALLRERAVIRGELERNERQKQAVSSSADTTFGRGAVRNGNKDTPETNTSHGRLTHTSSWACIAKKPNIEVSNDQGSTEDSISRDGNAKKSFADALVSDSLSPESSGSTGKDSGYGSDDAKRSIASKTAASSKLKGAASSSTSQVAPSFFNQSYNDIIEVLCSGPTTSGKLLMHFFLFYGHHFDAQNTSIDLTGKHQRGGKGHMYAYSLLSPFITRKTTGSFDPRTGMLTVDPIVIYDPLEGAEMNNVAKRCFAWSSVKWLFANSYNTLSKVVEASVAPNESPDIASSSSLADEASVDLTDPASPLLKCLLSY